MGDNLKVLFKGGGIALASILAYRLGNKGVKSGTLYFSTTELKAISAFVAFNEFLFFAFFERVFGHDKKIMKSKKAVRMIILSGILIYSSPIFLLSNPNYKDYARYVYTISFAIKCLVGSQFLAKLKLNSMEDASAFIKFVMAVAFGIVAKQLNNY